MQQVFFQETEFLNSVIDYNHKIEAENLCLDIAYGTDKNFLFGCGISIASILKYNEGNQLCFHIFTDYFGDDDRKYFDALARQYKTRIKIYLINYFSLDLRCSQLSLLLFYHSFDNHRST